MKNKNLGMGITLFAILISIFLVQIIIPDQEISEKEQRALAQKPDSSISSYQEGKFQKNYEEYIEDQFPLRYKLMSLKTKLVKGLGVKKIQDVYFGENGRLIQEPVYPTEEVMNLKANLINAFQEQNPDIIMNMMLIPNKAGIYAEEIDTEYQQLDFYDTFLSKLTDKMIKINAKDILLAHKEEKIFYDTDHHWTTLSAKYLADEFLKDQETKYEYDVYVSNNHFIGTLANKISYEEVEDVVEIYLPKTEDIVYYVTYPEEGKSATTVYDLEKQYSSNAYEVFFGGNHARIDIATNVSGDKRLLIFKDSYANCLIPFLIPYYSEIVVIDPRYYYGDIMEIINGKKITDVLFLYNMNTFFGDTSLETILNQSNE